MWTRPEGRSGYLVSGYGHSVAGRQDNNGAPREPGPSLVGIWSWHVASNRVQLSKETYRIYGIDPATFSGAFEDCLQSVHPDDLERIQRVTERALMEKRGFPVEFRVLRPNGDERLVRADADVFLDATGEVERMAGMLQDITDEQIEVARRLRLSAAIEQVPEAMLITDPQGVVLYANAAFERSTGYSRDEAIGNHARFLHEGALEEAAFEEMRVALDEGRLWAGRLHGRRKDGRTFLLDTTVSPIHDNEGRVVNFVAVQRDVTHDVALEEQLRNVHKMEAIAMLAGGIAHDFNNVLIAIIGHSDLIMMKVTSDSEVHRHAKEVRKAGERARILTAQLLAFSRKQVLQPRVLDLNDVLDDVESLMLRVVGEDIHLRIQRWDGPASIDADAGQMEQVIINLATNACEAMPSGGSLRIGLTIEDLGPEAAEPFGSPEPGRYVVLKVADTGIGMDEQTRRRMFEPFFTTKDAGLGTGLGLATVHGVVHQSGGGISVKSGVGAGTTFKVCLPLSKQAVAPEKPLLNRRAGATKRKTILVVEDEPLVATIVRNTLRAQGYAVLYAENGVKALELASAHDGPIDLLFTDVVMPRMGGLTLSERLLEVRPNTRVLFSSGYADSALRERGTSMDGIDLLQKPYTPDILVERIRNALDDELLKSRLTGG